MNVAILTDNHVHQFNLIKLVYQISKQLMIPQPNVVNYRYVAEIEKSFLFLVTKIFTYLILK